MNNEAINTYDSSPVQLSNVRDKALHAQSKSVTTNKRVPDSC